MKIPGKAAVLLTGMALLAASACSTSGPGGDASSGVPGVTDSTIRLGYMSDLSGPIATQGKTDLAATRLYLKKINDAGGVCGREIELEVSDMAYDVQKAVSQYPSTTPNVLGYLTILGTPMLKALGPRIQEDGLTVGALDLDSSHIGSPNIIQFGATYDIEDVNGLAYLADKGVIKKGDTLGKLYWPGYGENALKGFEWAADQLGMKTKAIEVDPAKTDLTTEVQQLRSAGVSLISLSVLQAQTAAVAQASQAMGWDVPLMGNDPTFVPQVMSTPAKDALIKRLYVTSHRTPLSAEANKEVLELFRANPTEGIDESDGLVYGWVNAVVYIDVLKRACDNDNLTREGMLEALRQSKAIDTGGSLPTLDYSQVGEPATRATYVSRPAEDIVGGLKLVSDGPYESDIVADYPMPGSD